MPSVSTKFVITFPLTFTAVWASAGSVVFLEISVFIVATTLLDIFLVVASNPLYVTLIFLVISITLFPFVFVSISLIVSTQVIVLSDALYVPPAKSLTLVSSNGRGNVSTIVTVASPI